MGSEHSAKAQESCCVSNLHGFGHIIKYYFYSGSSAHISNNCKFSSKLWTWTPLFSCHISISGHDPTSFDEMPSFVRFSYIKPCSNLNPASRCSVTALSQTGSSGKTVAPDALLAEQKSNDLHSQPVSGKVKGELFLLLSETRSPVSPLLGCTLKHKHSETEVQVHFYPNSLRVCLQRTERLGTVLNKTIATLCSFWTSKSKIIFCSVTRF